MIVHLPMPIVHAMHVFLQSIILIYIGYTGNLTHDYLYLALLGTAILIPVFVPAPNFDDKNKSTIVRLFHYLILLPLLTYISYMGYFEHNISNVMYTIMLIAGIFAFFYHAFKFVMRLKGSD